jgi:hypothetical protein
MFSNFSSENRAVYEIMSKNMVVSEMLHWQYGGALHAGLVRLHACKRTPAPMHTHKYSCPRTHPRAQTYTKINTKYLFFHDENGFVNAPQCYVTHRWRLLLRYLSSLPHLLLVATYLILTHQYCLAKSASKNREEMTKTIHKHTRLNFSQKMCLLQRNYFSVKQVPLKCLLKIIHDFRTSISQCLQDLIHLITSKQQFRVSYIVLNSKYKGFSRKKRSKFYCKIIKPYLYHIGFFLSACFIFCVRHHQNLHMYNSFIYISRYYEWKCMLHIVTVYFKWTISAIKYYNVSYNNSQWPVRINLRICQAHAYRALAGKREGRRPLGRPRRRWEDNIKMDLREVGWRGHGVDQCGSG